MEWTALFLLLLVLIFIVLFVTRPFFERRRLLSAHGNPALSSLLAERERLLTALQELDFDQTLGKIPAEDYPIQRAELLQKGADVLRQLDALTPATAAQTRLDNKPASAARLSDDDLEDLLADRRNTHKDKSAGFCPKCGKPVLRSDAFCPSCGSPLI